MKAVEMTRMCGYNNNSNTEYTCKIHGLIQTIQATYERRIKRKSFCVTASICQLVTRTQNSCFILKLSA